MSHELSLASVTVKCEVCINTFEIWFNKKEVPLQLEKAEL